MGRILAIDYGTKRVGMAVSDPLKIVATGLDTLPEPEVLGFLKDYLNKEEVETIVVGDPLNLDGSPGKIAPLVNKFVAQLKKQFPASSVILRDERFTSEDAKKIILQSGAKKKKRRDKALVDKVSAVLILQDYLEEIRNSNLI